jgi:hypothetical protein
VAKENGISKGGGMSEQVHNLGYLRMAVEDCLVAYLTGKVDAKSVRAAYTTTAMEHPLVVVHAKSTAVRNATSYSLSRNVDVEIRCITYAEAETDSAGTELYEAREAHFKLLAQVYQAMAQADILTRLQSVQSRYVTFSMCYVLGESASIADGSYVTSVNLEIIATPKEL